MRRAFAKALQLDGAVTRFAPSAAPANARAHGMSCEHAGLTLAVRRGRRESDRIERVRRMALTRWAAARGTGVGTRLCGSALGRSRKDVGDRGVTRGE